MKLTPFISMCLLIFLMSLGCNSSKDVPSTTTPVIGKVMVLLDHSTTPKKLEMDMKDYGLTNQGQISRSEYRFQFTYDASKVSEEDLINELNALPYCSEAKIPEVIK